MVLNVALFSAVFLVTISSARGLKFEFNSLPDVFASNETQNVFDRAHSICKHDKDFYIAFVGLLFCEKNMMKIRCDSNTDVLLKLAEDNTLSTNEIEMICTSEMESQENENERSCKHNISITLAKLVCDRETHAQEVEKLTRFAMNTQVDLPIVLQNIKNDEMRDDTKRRIMKSYLGYHPRYLWVAFVAREQQLNADADKKGKAHL